MRTINGILLNWRCGTYLLTLQPVHVRPLPTVERHNDGWGHTAARITKSKIMTCRTQSAAGGISARSKERLPQCVLSFPPDQLSGGRISRSSNTSSKQKLSTSSPSLFFSSFKSHLCSMRAGGLPAAAAISKPSAKFLSADSLVCVRTLIIFHQCRRVSFNQHITMAR